MEEKYYTFWPRFWSGVIDGLIMVPLVFLDFLFLEVENIAVIIPYLIFIHTSWYVYSITMHWKYGQTFGKMVMDVKVMDVSESRGLTLKQAFMRDGIWATIEMTGLMIVIYNIITLGYYEQEISDSYDRIILYMSLLWICLEILTMMTNSKRRSMHDMIAKTVVIRTENKTANIRQ